MTENNGATMPESTNGAEQVESKGIFKLTEEQKKISGHNNYVTRKLLNVPDGYVLHHVDETLRFNDVERYIEWRPEDVVVMSMSDHNRLHGTGKVVTDSFRQKMSNIAKERNFGQAFAGHKLTPEHQEALIEGVKKSHTGVK